jgi:hypothetical protein
METDAILGTVGMASRGRSAAAVGPRAALADLEVALRARSFARANADLLGLIESDFDELDWEVMTPLPIFLAGGLTVWEVSASSRARVPPPPFPAIARGVRIHITFHRDGEIVGAYARIDPEVSMCTTPGLTADQARRAPGIVGHPLSFYGNRGRQDVGIVEAADVGIAELMIERISNAPREYRLFYRVHVERGGFPWYFYVDAWTGKLLGSGQAFQI